MVQQKMRAGAQRITFVHLHAWQDTVQVSGAAETHTAGQGSAVRDGKGHSVPKASRWEQAGRSAGRRAGGRAGRWAGSRAAGHTGSRQRKR